MQWSVTIKKKLKKQLGQLPKGVKANLIALIKDIENYGPVRGNWPNYGQLSRNRHHCHIKKGQPTYVAVWEVKENLVRFAHNWNIGILEYWNNGIMGAIVIC